ncbi:hypothetical protein AAC387_Pa07g2008 [Persea americana]
MTQTSQELVPYPTPEGQPIWVHPDLLKDENWEIVKTKSTAQQRRQAKRQLRKLKQQEKAQTKTRFLKRQKPPLPLHKGHQRSLFPRPQECDTASDIDEWEESLETREYLSDEEWISESHLMPVEPKGVDEEEDLAPMPNLEEYAMILQRLAIEQEQDHINQLHQNPELEVLENLQASPPVTPENEESCWIDDPLTSEDESDSQQSIVEASSIKVACNVIAQDDSASEASSAEATDSQNTSHNISSGATYSRVTSTEITPSQPSSPKTDTSEFKPLPTDHHEEALVDEIFKENPVNCNAITEDGNAAAEAFLANGEDRPLEPEGGLPKEEPPLEAIEVGKGTRSGRNYHKKYNQPSFSSCVNPSGKQAINALSGNNNENAGPKEAFKYDLIEHFKHIPARLHILDLLRMSPQTRDSLISELQRLNVDVDKHAPQVLQIEMDYRVKNSKTSSNGENKKARGPCTECLSVQKAASATVAFNKENLLLGKTKHNRPLYFTGYIKEMPIHRVQIDSGSALNLISTTALEELGIPPSKLSHTSVSIFGCDGSAQRPIGKIQFRLQIGDLISEVTVYAIKTPSCYNILLGRPWIHENGVVPSTLHQYIKFVGNDGLIHQVFADKKPFKGKEVYFADPQMYKDEKEKEEEKIASLASNLQKDKARLLSNHRKKTNLPTNLERAIRLHSLSPSNLPNLCQADAQQVRLSLTPLETPSDVEDPASATFIVPATLAEEKSIFFHTSDASSSNSLLEPFQNEDAWFSDSEEPSSPKEVPYFDPVLVGDWDHLIASLEKNTDQEDLWTEAEPWS